MTDKSDSGVPLFFVTKSGSGYEAGVYTQKELQDLPAAAKPFVISIAVAESLGYVTLDHSTGKNINELEVYGSPDFQTGKIKKYRGVLEGTADSHPLTAKVASTTNKIGNALRETLQDIKQKSTEDSLKAKIEAKKKELNSNKE